MVCHSALSALEFSVSALRNSVMQKLASNARPCSSRSLKSLPWNWNSPLTWQSEKDSVVCCLHENYLLCLSCAHGQFIFTEVCHLLISLSYSQCSHPQFLVHQQLLLFAFLYLWIGISFLRGLSTVWGTKVQAMTTMLISYFWIFLFQLASERERMIHTSIA